MAAIAIMEDDVFLAHTWESDLLAAGYEVLITRNADEAMSLLESRPIDLLICDMFIRAGPDLSKRGGTALLGRLQHRRLEQNPSAPWLSELRVLAVSGASAIPGGFDILRSAKELGADNAVRKPMSTRTLLDRVAELIQRESPA